MAIKARAQKTLTKVFDGSGVFSIIITNENTSIPISNQGLPLNYSSTPTDAYVYSGTSLLTPVSSNPEAGQYTLTATGENISAGLVTINGNHASVANASNMSVGKDTYSITLTASGKDFLGNPFSAQKKQVITPLKRGDDATSYWENVTSSVITKDVKGNMTPDSSTVSAVYQSGMADPDSYKAIFKVYLKSGINFSTTPDYTSSAPESSYKITPKSDTNDIKVEMYDVTGTSLLDIQTIPVISQANGVISTEIVYTVTSTQVQPNDTANWSNTIPSVGKGQYLWSRTTFYYTDGSNAVAYSMGSNGKDGASAPLLTLTSDSQIVTFDSDGSTPIPASQTITLTAVLQNLTGTATFVATPYSGTAAGTPITLGGTGNVRTITASQFGSQYDSVSVKATLGELSDTETIHKLTKGADGTDGTDGKNGTDGAPGPKGADGRTSYVHVAYANSADGTSGFSTTDATGKSYVGVYTDFTAEDSNTPSVYTWSLIKGQDGANGIQGPKGADGISTYVHFAYANSSDGTSSFSTTDTAGRAYVGTLTDTVEQDSTDPTKYTWSLIKGSDGTDGKNGSDGAPGPKGADGRTSYVHVAYANSADGTSGFSTTDATGKSYIGVYTDFTAADSNTPSLYTWSLIKGSDGKNGTDGAPGTPGADGKTTYIHIAYANSADGKTDFSTSDNSGKKYIGVLTDEVENDSTDYTQYVWSLFKGQDGTDGADGTPGKPGVDGKTTYVHFAYANSSDGKTDFSVTDYSNKKFIGTLTDYTVPDSTDYTKYTWSLIKGADGKDGANGIQGPKGADGRTSYIHFAYANSSNGSTSFSTTDPTGRAYVGTLTDFVEQDSTNYADYTWSLIKGADGQNGSDGAPGPKGADGRTSYVHVAYANSSNGSTSFSTTDPTGRAYVGVYTDFTEADSTTPSVYTWSLIKGSDGKDGSDGIQGPKGADGISTYVHFAYANSSDGKTNFSVTDPTGRAYVGTLTDTTVADSTDPTKYTWSLIKGADGTDGKNGVNSYSGWLTNESITLQADSNGNVPSFTSATGSFVVYNGLTQVTGLTVTQANASGITISITGMNYSVTGMSSDNGYVDLSITTSGITIIKRLTVSKSKAGATGANGTSVVNSTTPPSNPTEGQWWNDLSVTPNILKVYQKGSWIPYRIDAINLVSGSVKTDNLAADVLLASNVKYTNSNGTTTNLQTFDFDGIKTLLTDNNGNTYSSMDTAVSSTQSWTSLSKQVNSLGQINQLFNTEFSPDLQSWENVSPLSITASVDNSNNYNGSNIINLVHGANVQWSQFSQSINNFVKGSQISVSVWAKATQSNSSVTIDSYDSSNTRTIIASQTLKDVGAVVKLENIIVPANSVAVYIAFWSQTTGSISFSQPMLVFSQSIGDYVQGNYNNNARVLAIETSANQFQVKISGDVKTAQDSADSANNAINNLSVGGRNLFIDSKTQTNSSAWFSGNGNWNDGRGTYLGSNILRTEYAWTNARYSYKDLLDRGVINTTDDFTYSIYFRVVGEDPANMSYANIMFFSNATTKDATIPLQLTSLKEGQWTRIIVPLKFINVEYDPSPDKNYGYSLRVEASEAPKVAGAYYEFAAPMLERGNKATDWTPAPEDQSAEITTKLKLATDSYTLGIDSNGNLISGISGNAQSLSLNGATIYLNSKTVIADDFTTRLLSAYDATIGNTLTIGTGGSIQSVLGGKIWDFTPNSGYYLVDNTNPWFQVDQTGTFIMNSLGDLEFNGTITAPDKGKLPDGSTPYAYPTQTTDGSTTVTWTNKLTTTTSLGIQGLRVDQQNYNRPESSGGFSYITGHGIFTGMDQVNPRGVMTPDGNLYIDTVNLNSGYSWKTTQVPTAVSKIWQGVFNGTANMYLDAAGYVRIANAAGNSGGKIYVNGDGVQLFSDVSTLVLGIGHSRNGYLYYESKKSGSGGSAVKMAGDGAFFAQTSATKYKTNIQYDTTSTLADRLMTLDLASWNDKGEEDMRVAYKTYGDEPDYAINLDGSRYVGLIAEDLVKANLEEFVVRDPRDGTVESIEYDKIGIALIPAVRQQREMINELRLEIERLKDKVQ